MTVMADGRQADVSLPAQQPVVTLIPQLRALLSLKAEPPGGPWTLSTTAHGILNPERSLDDAGIIDAAVVHLTPPQEAPEPPFVEDVVDEAAARLDGARTVGEGLEWVGDARVAGMSALAAAVLVFSALLCTTVADSGPLVFAVLIILGVVTTGLTRLLPRRGGMFTALAGVPVWALAGWCGSMNWGYDPVVTVAVSTVGVGIAFLPFTLLGGRYLAVGIAGGVLGSSSLLVVILVVVGLPLDRTIAVTTVLLLVVIGLAPQFAVANSGLVDLIRAEERAEQVRRAGLTRSVAVGQSLVSGIAAGTAVAASVAVAVLLLQPGVPAPALGATTALIFALRSRAFTRAEHVFPILVVATTGLATAAAVTPPRLGLAAVGGTFLTTGLLVAAVVAILALSAIRLGDITAVRLSRMANALETIAMILLVPLVFLVFDAYDFARRLVACC
ncbi:EsaB/YukD family protein [Actinosynnema sp. NPDC059797]